MWSLIQGVALVSLSVIGFFLLRRSLRKFNTIAMVMTALLVALGLPVGASGGGNSPARNSLRSSRRRRRERRSHRLR